MRGEVWICPDSLEVRKRKCEFVAIFWVLWLERNDCVFHNKGTDLFCGIGLYFLGSLCPFASDISL